MTKSQNKLHFIFEIEFVQLKVKQYRSVNDYRKKSMVLKCKRKQKYEEKYDKI